LPVWRWRTVFDRQPSSISIVYEEKPCLESQDSDLEEVSTVTR
jgi:hypothetical protein